MQSYVNAAVSAAEDPEKLLDQSVLEMNEDLVKLRQTTAQVPDCHHLHHLHHFCDYYDHHQCHVYVHMHIYITVIFPPCFK